MTPLFKSPGVPLFRAPNLPSHCIDDCCGELPCPQCDTFTSVVISNLTNSCTPCQNLEGTYVLRTLGGSWLANCSFFLVPPGWYQTGTACSGIYVSPFVGSAANPAITLVLTRSGPQIVCTIYLTVVYTNNLFVPSFESRHQSIFQATVDECEDLTSATFNLIDSNELGFGSLPGDVCGMNSATISLVI